MAPDLRIGGIRPARMYVGALPVRRVYLGDELVWPSSILSRATAAWAASAYSGSGALLDITGNGHDAQLGSTAGADANDPLFLTDGPYLYLPGIASNYASVPDAAALDIGADLDLRVEVQLDDYTPSASCGLLSKFVLAAPASTSYMLYLQSNGVLILFLSNGVSTIDVGANAATGVIDGTRTWLRATWRQSDGRVQFLRSTDGSTWTQIGTDRTLSAGITIHDSATALSIGSYGGSEPAVGRFYSARIYASIDDTDERLNADFTDLAAYNAARTSLSAVTGQTVTINRSAAGRKAVVVDRPLFLLGIDDYFHVPDHADLDFGAVDDFTIVVVERGYGGGNPEFLLSKMGAPAGSSQGYELGTRFAAARATIYTSSGGFDDALSGTNDRGLGTGTLAARVNRTSGTLEVLADGVVKATDAALVTGDISNGVGVVIGARFTANEMTLEGFWQGEFMAAAIFREALTDEEIIQAGTELLEAA